jgi:hypothetical protein
VLEGGVLARCPSCRATFSTDRTGRQECPSCHKPLLVPEAPAATPAAPPAAFPEAGLPPGGEPPPPEPPAGTPWERRGEGAWLTAWRETLVMAFFEPGRLFSLVRVGDRRSQTWFAVLTGTLSFVVSALLGRLLSALTHSQEQSLKLAEELSNTWLHQPLTPAMRDWIAAENSWPMLLGTLLLAPLVVLVLVYANALVTHLSALLLGKNKRGFDATFAAAAYGLAPLVLILAPGCGGIAATIWAAVLTGIGLKRLHGISPEAAAGATLAPYLLCCCCPCLLGLFSALSVFSRMQGLGQ